MVTYLLDTAPFLWAVASPEKLSAKVRKLIDNRKNPLFVSVASLWEIVVKAQKGLLPIQDPPRWLDAGLVGIEAAVLPIKPAHVYGVSQLPMIHKDPFDRLLLAQAASEGWVLISSDATLRQYRVPTIW
ncbi:MAG: type II toxin-antitoxin system VapC family toxin [Bryobacteraceae bacterium]